MLIVSSLLWCFPRFPIPLFGYKQSIELNQNVSSGLECEKNLYQGNASNCRVNLVV